ncbi:muscular LMNA-interacting protein isoform X5 [Engystomops pustulosus]|uniref:muscular LMNA-interacting protein isoform X5 n=1 Tax=Engystomops pustulosus TaxID=76066 RepID=UPI003AFA53F1
MDFDKKSKPMSDMISREKGMVSPTDGGTIPVNFTFVPSIGMLPSEVLLAKESNYHPKVVGPKGILLQKGILKQTECGAFEELVENDIPENVPEKLLQEKMYESPQTILKTVHKAASKDRFLQKQFASNDLEDIKHNDLFIAEFVVLMDSDDEEDVKIAKTSQSLSFEETKYGFGEKLKQSTAQHPRETVEDIKVKETYIPRSQKDCCNVGNLELQKMCSVPPVGLDSYSPNSNNITQAYRKQITNSASVNIDKGYSTVKDAFHTPLSTEKSTSSRTLSTECPLRSHSRRSLYSPTDLQLSQHKSSKASQSERSNVMSPLPIQVIKYPLCRSPSPLNSTFFGSSSTICSMNECTSPVPRSDAASPVSSRLSFLTSLLKSKRSGSKRTISPDPHYQSEPKTISLTPLAFQKSTMTPDVPRKSTSCFSLSNPRESRMLNSQRKADIMPAASESDILRGEFSFHQSPNRALSPESIYFMSSPRGSVSPSSQLHRRSVTPPYSSRECILPLNDKPPISRHPCTPLKKCSVLGKSKRVTLFPPPLHFDQSHDKSHFKRYTSPITRFRSTSHSLSEGSPPRGFKSSSAMDLGKSHYSQSHSALLCGEIMETDKDAHQALHPSHTCQSFSFEELSRKNAPLCSLSTNISAQPRSILSRSCELPSGSSLLHVSDPENTKLYKIKSSYKSFAAIPTNTLLLDQKAIDEPETNARNSNVEDEADTHSEMCSPALLRQQTEEICAAIDEVLHDPFPLLSRPPMKSAGRETKYASLQPDMKAKATDSQTRPGVIRPMTTHENKDKKMYPNLYQQFSMPPYKKE